ncbi:Uu.00g104050.m01.CDS01 [Anthostomella pinea]|uniref:Uu.00g104050.m01.CDS01 n=1 Tax=Anthostomella pinea TaxID=933095 RepID=A0AAI8YD91_9PEZI|nr:Uu.00g104050.m01.CDS01 [Anthostomella pinea]
MKTTILPVAFLAATVAAQSTNACAAQPVVDTCLSTTQALVSLCSATDYACLCEKYTAKLVCVYLIQTRGRDGECFANCPNDPRAPGVATKKDNVCNNVSVNTAATTTAPAPKSISSSGFGSGCSQPAPSNGDAAPATKTGPDDDEASGAADACDGEETGTAHPGASAKTAGAAELMASAVGVLAAVAGAAVVIL